jgi:hypothetical protein
MPLWSLSRNLRPSPRCSAKLLGILGRLSASHSGFLHLPLPSPPTTAAAFTCTHREIGDLMRCVPCRDWLFDSSRQEIDVLQKASSRIELSLLRSKRSRPACLAVMPVAGSKESPVVWGWGMGLYEVRSLPRTAGLRGFDSSITCRRSTTPTYVRNTILIVPRYPTILDHTVTSVLWRLKHCSRAWSRPEHPIILAYVPRRRSTRPDRL